MIGMIILIIWFNYHLNYFLLDDVVGWLVFFINISLNKLFPALDVYVISDVSFKIEFWTTLFESFINVLENLFLNKVNEKSFWLRYQINLNCLLLVVETSVNNLYFWKVSQVLIQNSSVNQKSLWFCINTVYWFYLFWTLLFLNLKRISLRFFNWTIIYHRKE